MSAFLMNPNGSSARSAKKVNPTRSETWIFKRFDISPEKSALLLNRSYIPKTGFIGKPFWRAANSYLQGHLDTICCKLIVSDGRGEEEARRWEINKLTGFDIKATLPLFKKVKARVCLHCLKLKIKACYFFSVLLNRLQEQNICLKTVANILEMEDSPTIPPLKMRALIVLYILCYV